MPSEGFEAAIPAIEWLQTYAIESTATGIGKPHIRFAGNNYLPELKSWLILQF